MQGTDHDLHLANQPDTAAFARELTPAAATSAQLRLTPSNWSRGGCDGGPAGWTNMESVQTIRASGNVVADYEAKMQALQYVRLTAAATIHVSTACAH